MLTQFASDFVPHCGVHYYAPAVPVNGPFDSLDERWTLNPLL